MAYVHNKIKNKYDYYLKYGVLECCLAAITWHVFLDNKQIPTLGTYAFGAYVTYVGFYNLCTWYAYKRKAKNLNKLSEFAISSKRVREIADEENGLYVGEGFTWRIDERKAYQKIMSESATRALEEREDPEVGGNHFVQRLGHPKPIVIPLERHSLIAGTTGIGKTRLMELLCAQIIQRKEALVIIDPKGDNELLDMVYDASVFAGRKDDFVFFSLVHPTKSVCMNPCANYTTPNELGSRIGSVLEQNQSSGPFVAFCINVISIVCRVMSFMSMEINLKNIYRYTVKDMDALNTIAEDFALDKNNSDNRRRLVKEAIEELQLLIEHNRDHFQKMTTNLKPTLDALTAGDIGHILSPEKEDTVLSWREIFEDKKIVYFYLGSLVDEFTARNAGKLIIQDMLSYVGQAYAYGKKSETTTWIFVDEFATVGYPGFSDALNKTRGAGVRMVLGMQTLADIEIALSAKAYREQFLGNFENKLFLRVPDKDTAAIFADPYDEVQIESRKRSRTISASPNTQGQLFGSTYREDSQLTPVSLVPSDALTRSPRGHVWISTSGRQPIKGVFPIIAKAPEEQHHFHSWHIMGNPQQAHVPEFKNSLDEIEKLSPDDYEVIDI
jgi:conjugal transfer pilus assembly protein TraD